MSVKIKKELLNQCNIYVNQKIKTIEIAISIVKEGLLNETKSSAGDKFETTRAHLQQELSNLNKQLNENINLQTIVNGIKEDVNLDHVALGSVVTTSKANYFISVPAGKLALNNTTYFAISPSSPIAQLLIGKSVGETISFNKSQFVIKDLV